LQQATAGEDQPPVPAVDDRSDHEQEQDAGQELHQADQAEVERAAGQLVHLPAHGDHLDLGGQGRGEAR
jgi:hypothetical protein